MHQLSSHELEQQIIAMENRLACVKMTVNQEQDAWRQIAQSQTSKWQKATVPRPDKRKTKDENVKIVPDNSLIPSHWNSLELAQFLQAQELDRYAQVVLHEQINGKMLFKTLQQLFPKLVGDEDYNLLKRIVLQLQKTQRVVEAAGEPTNATTKKITKKPKEENESLPPLIATSPPLALIATSTSQVKGEKNRKTLSNRTRTPTMATCWNCNARFPRPPTNNSSVLGNQNARHQNTRNTNRFYCSKTCEERLECQDISVTPTLSVTSSPKKKYVETSRTTPLPRTPSIRPKVPVPSPSFDFICTPQASMDTRPSSKQQQPPSRQNMRGILASSCNSISGIRTIPDTPPTSNFGFLFSQSLQSNKQANEIYLSGLQSNKQSNETYLSTSNISKYKLDPEGIPTLSFEMVFVPHPRNKTLKNDSTILVLVQYLPIRTLYHLSLTNRSLYQLIHYHEISDSIWRLLFIRKWQTNLKQQVMSLQETGLLLKHYKKTPRKAFMRLTRSFQTLVLTNLKILIHPETWQLATIDGYYDTIAIILGSTGSIVAVQTQGMIRSIDENGSVMEILQGLQQGTLVLIHCRRLRLFSSTNRLPLEEWQSLVHLSIVFEFVSVPILFYTWHQMILNKLQSHMHQRLLGKESIQQVLKWIQTRYHHYHPTATVSTPGTVLNTNPITQKALLYFEQFLVHHQKKKSLK